MSNLQQVIEAAFEKRAEITPKLMANGLLING